MGNFLYENQGTNTYLVYEIGANDELDTMSLGMLTNNDIPGFAPASFTQMDNAKYIRFNVSAKVSAAQLFAGPVNKKRLIGVFSGIVNAMLAAEDYMLDPDSILLDLDYIFTDVSTCETELVCLPIINDQRKKTDLSMFFKNIIFSTQYDQTENCDHVAQILNYLNSVPVLLLTEFKELLDRIAKGGTAPAQYSQPRVATAEPVQRPSVTPQTPVAAPQHTAPLNAPAVNPISNQAPVNVSAKPQQPVVNYSAPTPPAVPAKNAVAAPAAPQKEEKGMSMFYLLQHYNKENAAAYKAQKEAKKNKKGTASVTPAQRPAAPVQPSNAGFAVPGKPQTNPGFAVPGQQPVPSKQNNTGFAVPNQQPAAPKQGNAGFAVPGKQPAPVQQAPAQSAPVQQAQPKVKNEQPASSVCPKCGTAVAKGQKFCVGCGCMLAEAAPKQQAPVVQPAPEPVVPAGTHISFGETTVLGGMKMGETTVLNAVVETKKNDPHLIRMKNNEKIPLNKPVFRIGKERSYVDYFVSDNTAVSRSHVNIVDHNGEFFVVDTNSTNHTYVNGGMIPSNVETKLSHGTKLRLANEEFEFRLY